jgi:hypothetical protein
MQAIFMARGPSFNKNIQINSLNNVDIYHIACRILNLTPNPHATAGSLANLTSLFPTIETDSTATRPSTMETDSMATRPSTMETDSMATRPSTIETDSTATRPIMLPLIVVLCVPLIGSYLSSFYYF